MRGGVKPRTGSRSAVAPVAPRVAVAHRPWSRTCPHSIAYGSLSMAAADASGGAFATVPARSCSPHAATSIALTAQATAAPAAWGLMSCLLLHGAVRRALGGWGRRPEPALDQRADLGDLADP